MIIQTNIFDLTQEQISMSKLMYNGNILKCLVAPYHTYSQLENVIPFTKNTYLFPEREASTSQIKSFISLIASKAISEEVIIITTNQNIIMDMIDDCVRVLTENDEILPSPCKTFMANIHDIRYSLLENKEHQKKDKDINLGTDKIRVLINKLSEKNKNISEEEYIKLKQEVDIIGEPLIRERLNDMLSNFTMKKSSKVMDFIYERASKSKNEDEYINIATRLVELYKEQNLTDDQIIENLKK